MTIVIDTSVALKWVLPEQGSEHAFALRGSDLAASEILLVEAANAIWRHVTASRIDPKDGTNAFERLRTADVALLPIENDVTAALALGLRLRHPVYDCLYLAGAIRASTHLVTADARFVAAVRRFGDLKKHIRLLGES